MQIPKPTDEDRARFNAAVPEAPGVAVKPMFGNLGAFVNDNMFAGLFGSSIGVKLADAERGELAALGGGPFGPEERPMGGYTTVPEGVDAALWAAKAHEHVATFPPKVKKGR